MIERHFGESAPLSIGVEEEVMILDAGTRLPVGEVDVLLDGAAELDLPGTLKKELHASVIELTTGVCADVEEAVAALRELRAAADRIARANGLVIAAAGAHPTAPLASLPIVEEDRYLDMVERIGPTARRQGVNGLHVHVGVESAERAYERLEAVLGWLPVVLALSANSPFVDGQPTGMLSNRAGILAELPRGGMPPCFGSYHGVRVVGRAARRTRRDGGSHAHLVGRAAASDVRHARDPYRRPADDARADGPHRRTGAQTRRGRARARVTHRGDYIQNRWAAARRGLDAELLHPAGDRCRLST